MPVQPLLLPVSARQLLRVCHRLDTPALLYSGSSGSADDSYTRPRIILACQPDELVSAHSLDDLNALIQRLQLPDTDTPEAIFRSGWLGYFGYDAGELLLKLRDVGSSATPLAEFGYYPLSLEIFPDTDECWLWNVDACPDNRVQQLLQHLDATLALEPTEPEASAVLTTDWQPAWEFERYQQAFDQVQAYLRSGDAYQVNLTMPYYSQQDLRDHNPMALLQPFNAPFSGYFRTPALTLFSVSPERFIRVEQRLMTTSPIKGTAPRSSDAQQDEHNREWLRNSAKNQAENLMIVDLLRNDLGMSAEIGTVKVEKLFDIESHANVHHMVSTIVARVLKDLYPIDVIVSALPGGSITGAPKRRAMEIIRELEADRRGLYCGSFGYVDNRGTCDFNILIRSIQAFAHGANCWAGGGIVIDSDAAGEYQEIKDKIGRLLGLNSLVSE